MQQNISVNITRHSVKDNTIFNTTVFCCLLFGISHALTLFIPHFKYVKYLMPLIIAVITAVTSTKSRYIPHNPLLVKLLLSNLSILFGSSILALVRDPSFELRSLEEMYFTVSPILSVLLLMHNADEKSISNSIIFLFWTYCLYFICDLFVKGTLFLLMNYDIKNFQSFITDSESTGESHAGYVFGIICVYFFNNKYKWYTLVALILVFASSKRIVLLGVMFSLVFILFNNENFTKNKLAIYRTIFILFAMTLPLILILLANGLFDDIIGQLTNTSLDQLTQGRVEIYNLIIDNFGYPSLLGTGYGSTQAYLVSIRSDNILLHSDLLKLMYELGIPLYIVWLVINCRILVNSYKVLPYVIYFFVLLITDNVYIYFDFLFVFYLIVFYQKNHQLIKIYLK